MASERRLTFDERLWPVAVSLVALTALLVGMASRLLPWEETRWWRNAAFYVALIPILGAMVVALVCRFGRYISDRALALSFVWSLGVNLGLLFALGMIHLQSGRPDPVAQRKVAEARPVPERPVVPELQVRGSDRPVDDLRRAVEAGRPELVEPSSADRRWELSQQARDPTELLASLPMGTRPSMGSEVRRATESAPHRSPLPSQIGRRTILPEPGLPSTIPAPNVTGEQPETPTLEPSPTRLARSEPLPVDLPPADQAPPIRPARPLPASLAIAEAERLGTLPPAERPRPILRPANPSPVATEPSGGREPSQPAATQQPDASPVPVERLAQARIPAVSGGPAAAALPRAEVAASSGPATDQPLEELNRPPRQPSPPSRGAAPTVADVAEVGTAPVPSPGTSLEPAERPLERLAAPSSARAPAPSPLTTTSPPEVARTAQPAPPISPLPNREEALRGALPSPRLPAALAVDVPDVSGQAPASQGADRPTPIAPSSVAVDRSAASAAQASQAAMASQAPRAQLATGAPSAVAASLPDAVASPADASAATGERPVETPSVVAGPVPAPAIASSAVPRDTAAERLEASRSEVQRSGSLGQLAPSANLPTPARPVPVVGARPAGAVAHLERADLQRPSASASQRFAAPRVTIPGVRLDDEDAPSQLDRILAGAASQGGPDRREPGSIDVDVDQESMLSGLAHAPWPSDPGTVQREAQPDSPIVPFDSSRFIRRHLASATAVNPPVVAPAEAFRRRLQQRGAPLAGGQGTPPPRTDEAIERGLLFLARHQNRDGHWSLEIYEPTLALDDEAPLIASDTAATGLALLSFLGAGYHHRDFDYRDRVRLGLLYLIDGQKETGDLYRPEDPVSNQSAWLYSHAIAALALCEAYGMTQDPNLEGPAQRSIDFIVQSQHPERGGWRYSPQFGSDTSVTGWMLMALKSGELAGLEVPETVYERLDVFLDRARYSPQQPHLFRYNPEAPDTPETRHGRFPSPTMTSVGLLMRLYTGTPLSSSTMQDGAEYLLHRLPTDGSTRQPQRDTYYWYYATQVMFHVGGESWEAWRDHLYPLLIDSQVRQGPLSGSWDPLEPVPDRWAAHAGRLYVTTMNLLSLEVYYRHLPLYANARPER